MAILDALPGFKATVQSGNVTLPEYAHDGEWTQKYRHLPEERRSIVYVECVSDAKFAVQVELNEPFKIDSEILTFDITVDGHAVAKYDLSRLRYEKDGRRCRIRFDSLVQRINENEVSKRALKFSSITKVDSVDSDRLKGDTKIVAGLGEIMVTVRRAVEEAVSPSKSSRAIYTTAEVKTPTEIAEKALKGKALSHGVSFGSEVRQAHPSKPATSRVRILDRENPIGVLIFKYRSREALQSELIVPRSPSPEPVMGALDVRTGNENLRHSRDQRLPKLKKEISEIKAEEGDTLGKRKRAEEGNEIPRSGRAYESHLNEDDILVVDLTED